MKREKSKKDLIRGGLIFGIGLIGFILAFIFMSQTIIFLYLLILYPFFSLIILGIFYLRSGFDRVSVSRINITIILIIIALGFSLTIFLDFVVKLLFSIL